MAVPPRPTIPSSPPPRPAEAQGFVPLRLPSTFKAEVSSPGRADAVVPLRGADLKARPLPSHGPPAPAPPPKEAAPTGPSPAEVQALIKKAEDKVRAEAKAELDRLKKELEENKARLTRAAEGVDALRQSWAEELRSFYGALLVRSVERICGEVPELLEGMLKARCAELADKLVGARQVLVRVHPDDVALATSVLGQRANWKVVGDPAIRGGCVAETAGGSMDASLDAALEALGQAVTAWQAEAQAQQAQS